jgi:hypothetical protein
MGYFTIKERSGTTLAMTIHSIFFWAKFFFFITLLSPLHKRFTGGTDDIRNGWYRRNGILALAISSASWVTGEIYRDYEAFYPTTREREESRGRGAKGKGRNPHCSLMY